MPTSHPMILSPVMEKILAIKPKSVLDLGIGFGKWGALTREYTDIWAWRFYRNEWRVQIDGIEAHENYRNPNWDMYSAVHIGQIQHVLPSLGQYDLIVMLEVLEHLEKEIAHIVLDEILRHTSQAIISFTNTHQEHVRDNPLEDHVSQWEKSELTRLVSHSEVLHETAEGAVLYLRK